MAAALPQLALGAVPPPPHVGPMSPSTSRDQQRSARNKIPQAPTMSAEDLVLVVRRALREEFDGMLTENEHFRKVLQHEVASALTTKQPSKTTPPLQEDVHARVDSRVARNNVANKIHTIEWDMDFDSSPDKEEKMADENTFNPGDFFSQEVKKVTQLNSIGKSCVFEEEPDELTRSMHLQGLQERVDNVLTSWMIIEEPPRQSRLARLLRSKAFEFVVCVVIIFNCAFMAVVTNFEVSNPGQELGWHSTIEWILQIFYTLELIPKFVVHRQYFFVNESWRLNVFDLALVVFNFMTLLGDGAFFGGFRRFLRLFKFAKALRAVKLMTELKHLHAFMVCIQGSLFNFFWSMVMLGLVFFIFALIIVQLVASALVDGTELSQMSKDLYGSVAAGMFTLYKASTGGDDWSTAYNAASETGELAGVVFIVFISFTQLALINIITGTFVEAAMSSLSQSREVAAREHARMEMEHADELKALCRQVDHDRSGKLTPHQFEDGIRRGRIPRLLMLLGLSQSHVIQMFRTMSEQAKQDEGQVPIDKFVDSCMQLKGAATMYDLQWFQAQVMVEFMKLHKEQKQLMSVLSRGGFNFSPQDS